MGRSRQPDLFGVTDDMLEAHIRFGLSFEMLNAVQISGSSMGLTATGFSEEQVIERLLEQAREQRASMTALGETESTRNSSVPPENPS